VVVTGNEAGRHMAFSVRVNFKPVNSFCVNTCLCRINHCGKRGGGLLFVQAYVWQSNVGGIVTTGNYA
jgi:hypothetical protein